MYIYLFIFFIWLHRGLQNMQVACFNEFGGTQVKLLIWAGHFYSRGTWYMGKTNAD